MKIRRVGVELLHADGQTDRHDEANGLFSQFVNSSNKIRCLPAEVLLLLRCYSCFPGECQNTRSKSIQ
jgi:hypothetical protein